jgi:hypothetical protein
MPARLVSHPLVHVDPEHFGPPFPHGEGRNPGPASNIEDSQRRSGQDNVPQLVGVPGPNSVVHLSAGAKRFRSLAIVKDHPVSFPHWRRLTFAGIDPHQAIQRAKAHRRGDQGEGRYYPPHHRPRTSRGHRHDDGDYANHRT